MQSAFRHFDRARFEAVLLSLLRLGSRFTTCSVFPFGQRTYDKPLKRLQRCKGVRSRWPVHLELVRRSEITDGVKQDHLHYCVSPGEVLPSDSHGWAVGVS